jgi:hypothetical protein
VTSFPDILRELWALLKSYAMQELYEPLKGLPMYVGLGMAGAVTTVLGAGIFLLGILRFFQTEHLRSGARGGTSALPYLIVSVCSFVLAYWLVKRINRQFERPS